MRTLLLFCSLLALTRASEIHNALRAGLCLCVADGDVYARTGPGPDNYVVGTLQTNQCFVSNGGLYHDHGQTWYELKGLTSQTVWVDGYHLRAKNATECPGATVVFVPLKSCLENGNIYAEGDVVSKSGQRCSCRSGAVICPIQSVG